MNAPRQAVVTAGCLMNVAMIAGTRTRRTPVKPTSIALALTRRAWSPPWEVTEVVVTSRTIYLSQARGHG
jgi:hypothetical protein